MMELKRSTNGNIIYKKTYPDNFEVGDAIGETVAEYRNDKARLSVTEKWFKGIHISLIEIDSDLPEEIGRAHV